MKFLARFIGKSLLAIPCVLAVVGLVACLITHADEVGFILAITFAFIAIMCFAGWLIEYGTREERKRQVYWKWIDNSRDAWDEDD